MTREEATTKLKWFLESNLIEDISGCEGLKEAIGMAVEALANAPNVLNALDTINRQAAIDALCRRCDLVSDDEPCTEECNDIKILKMLPSAQPEPTRILETRAIPSDDDRVSLSETVTATYYDEEKEEWSRKIVTVRDVLDSVCDEYTILPSAQPERKKGKWIDETFEPWGLVHHPYKCDQCGEHSEADSNYCPNCGAKMEVEE